MPKKNEAPYDLLLFTVDTPFYEFHPHLVNCAKNIDMLLCMFIGIPVRLWRKGGVSYSSYHSLSHSSRLLCRAFYRRQAYWAQADCTAGFF